MENQPHKRTIANIKMLEFVARKLGALNNDVVYLGGCSTALFITDPLSLDVRPTKDVDCIVDVLSISEYYSFSNKLEKQGFKQVINEEIICRWHYDDAILDVMPTDEKILSFGNPWYRTAIMNTMTHQLADDLVIKSVTAPYLLATKIDAFKGRGQGDFLASHDLEDMIAVISGRPEIVKEVDAEDDKLKRHIKNFFSEIMFNPEFITALPGHVNDGSETLQRLRTITDRINMIVGD